MDVQRLFDTHGAFIARTIERLTGAGAHVDDLLQETFIIAFRKADKYDETRAAAATWLYGIASNLCRSHGRSRSRANRLFSFLPPRTAMEQSVEQPDQIMMRREEVRTVRQAIDRLPFRQREVFVLYELQGMEGKDSATLRDLKEGTVWTRLHHGRKTFKKLLIKKGLLHES